MSAREKVIEAIKAFNWGHYSLDEVEMGLADYPEYQEWPAALADAVLAALDAQPFHTVNLREDGWTLKHPLGVREEVDGMTTVFIVIGNSDNKLAQSSWSSYCLDVDRAFEAAVRFEGARVHGRWYSLPNEPWQNACWCAEWHADLAHVVSALKRGLAGIARAYGQDSIAWAEATTEFIGPAT